jgi:VCBS repeat protein
MEVRSACFFLNGRLFLKAPHSEEVSMGIRNNAFLSAFSLLLLLTLLLSCEQGVKQEEKKTAPISFHESSIGLPQAGMWRNGLAFYDMNGDGRLDITAPAPRKAEKADRVPHAWLQNADGSWQKMPLDVPKDVSYHYGDVSVNDFNQDGIPDMVLAMHVSEITLLLGSKSGLYTHEKADFPSTEKVTSRGVNSTDLNKDGIPDIAFCSEAPFVRATYVPSGIWVCLQSTAGWNCKSYQGKEKLGLISDQVVFGDVNGDGNKDIAVASLSLSTENMILLGDGSGGFKPFTKGLPKEIYYFNVALADVNGDGRDDLIAAVSGFGPEGLLGPRVFLSGSDGFTESSPGLPDKESITAIAATDLDGDSKVEIICATINGGILVYSQENGVWKDKTPAGLPKEGKVRIFSVYCLDVNNDGKKDIVFNHASEKYDTGGIRVFLNGR